MSQAVCQVFRKVRDVCGGLLHFAKSQGCLMRFACFGGQTRLLFEQIMMMSHAGRWFQHPKGPDCEDVSCGLLVWVGRRANCEDVSGGALVPASLGGAARVFSRARSRPDRGDVSNGLFVL